MLVLSRGRNDKVLFPELNITVEILNITGNKVRLGITAPPDVSVLRHELVDRRPLCEEAGDRPVPLSHAVRKRRDAAALPRDLPPSVHA